jgi:hypothetical protein
MERWLVDPKAGPRRRKLAQRLIGDAWTHPERNHGLWFSSTGMMLMSVWESTSGALAVLRGDPNGWERMSLGLHYRYWELRLLCGVFDQRRSAERAACESVIPPSLTLAHALATGNVEISEWIGNRMLRAMKDGAFGSWDVPLAPFIVNLFSLSQGSPGSLADVGQSASPLEAYAAVFTHWHDPVPLRDTLQKLCDYHASRASAGSGDDVPEFEEYPYCVFPAEIAALTAVRAVLGLETPLPGHPLMDSPLATPPIKVSPTPDATLSRLVERAKLEGVP